MIIEMPSDIEDLVTFSITMHDTLASQASVYTGPLVNTDLDFGGEWITASVTPSDLRPIDARKFDAVMANSRLKPNVLAMAPAKDMVNNSVGSSALTCQATALAGARTVTVYALSTDRLFAGAYVQIDSSLYVVLEDVVPIANGTAEIKLFPRLRRTFTAGLGVVVKDLKPHWKVQSQQRERTIRAPFKSSASYDLVAI